MADGRLKSIFYLYLIINVFQKSKESMVDVRFKWKKMFKREENLDLENCRIVEKCKIVFIKIIEALNCFLSSHRAV